MNYFISYSHFDYERAECLKKALSEVYDDRITGFLSSDRLLGRNYYTNIDSQLKRCDLLVFVATKNSILSDWCAYEIGFLNGRNKETVPILFDLSYTEMPDYIRLLLGARYDEKKEMKTALNQIFGNIKSIGDNEIRRFYSVFESTRRAALAERDLKLKITRSLERETINVSCFLRTIKELEQFNNDDTYDLLMLVVSSNYRHLRMEAVEQLKKYFIDRERFENMLAQFAYVSYSEIQELIEAFSHAINRNRSFWPEYKDLLFNTMADRENIFEDIVKRIESGIA